LPENKTHKLIGEDRDEPGTCINAETKEKKLRN
jgi:hypothetical protein